MDKNLLVKARDGKIVKFLSSNKAQIFGTFEELVSQSADVIYSGIDSSIAWKMLEKNKPFLVSIEADHKGKFFIIIGPYGLKGGGCGCSRKKSNTNVKDPEILEKAEKYDKDKTNTTFSKEQRDLQVQIDANLKTLESGVNGGIIGDIVSSLLSLRKIDLWNYTNPLHSSMRLLNCLKIEGIWEWRSWSDIRREIVKMTRSLLFYYYHKSENKVHLFQTTKNDLSKLARSIENRIKKNGSYYSENGTLCDIKTIRSAIELMKTDKKWYEELAKCGKNLIDCLAKKDIESGLELLKSVWEVLGDFLRSELSLNALVLEYLRDLLKKNPEAHDELLIFLKSNENSDWEFLYIILDEVEAAILDKDIDKAIREKFLEGDKFKNYKGFLDFANFNKYHTKNNWRIREKIASGLAKIAKCDDTSLQEKAKQKIADLTLSEKDKRVRAILKNPESVQEAHKILEIVWERRRDPIEELQEMIKNFIAQQQLSNPEHQQKLGCILVEVSKLNEKIGSKNSAKSEQWVSIADVDKLIDKNNGKIFCILKVSNASIEGLTNMHLHKQSENYESRSTDVENIWRYIPQEWNRDVVQIVIAGEEGVGKTQVAIEFVKIHQNYFGLIWWIDAGSKPQIEASYIKMSEALGVMSPSLYQKEIIYQIILRLERERKQWLLIFDNARSFEAVSEFIPKANGVVLITSRKPKKWEGNVYPLCSYEKALKASENSNVPIVQEQTVPSISEIAPARPVSSNMQVAIRIRPLNDKEKEDIVSTNEQSIRINDSRNNESKFYTFDKIFQNVDNETVFKNTALNLIEPALSGINACVLAYGTTGSGKTYTMTGEPDQPGIIPLTIREIFEKIQSDTNKVYEVMISYVQIYNEIVTDLLSENSGKIKICSDKKDTKIKGATEIPVKNSDEAMNWVLIGNKKRETSSTAANEHSSRSHSVIILQISQRENNADTVLQGKFLLVDLAGSEKGNVSNNPNRRIEGQNINKSLLALGNLFEALANKKDTGQDFVKYRDSKLTRILGDCLGGNCKNIMIANISPALSQYQESASTLYYANRAKEIKSDVQANRNFCRKGYKEYEKIISELKIENESLKIQCNGYLVSNQDKEQLYKDEVEMKKLKDEISKNFQIWSYLKKELTKIEEQESDIRMKQAQIFKWIKEETEEQLERELSVPDSIKEQYREIMRLKINIEKNVKEKENIIQKLEENNNQAISIKESIKNRIKYQDKREIINQQIVNYTSKKEIEELKIKNQTQEKDIEIERIYKEYNGTFQSENSPQADMNLENFEEIIEKLVEKGYNFNE